MRLSQSNTEQSRAFLDHWMPVIDGPEDLPRVPEILSTTGGEFCACERTDPDFVAAVCAAGYLPMGLSLPGLPVVLVKSHLERTVLYFRNLHVTRNARRYARGLTLFIDRNVEGTFNTIVDTYPDRWLIEPLVDSLLELHRKPRGGVAVHSFEVYDKDAFVAGEVGYTCGPVYTSLSGFHRRNGAGTAQLVATAEILRRTGFAFWDLGMAAAYKEHLGAVAVPRDEFLQEYRAACRATATGDAATPGDAAATSGAAAVYNGATSGGTAAHSGVAPLEGAADAWNVEALVRAARQGEK